MIYFLPGDKYLTNITELYSFLLLGRRLPKLELLMGQVQLKVPQQEGVVVEY